MDARFFPFFENCIGAIDGTLIPAVINAAEQGPFRDRKGDISQNILAAVDFDMLYTYTLVGWEGSAHDQSVLNDAVLKKGFPIIPGRYYLADAGFRLTEYALVPYRGVRYHLKEWRQGNQRPQNAKELFNLRHSLVRNVIERTFGVTKKKFPIMSLMHEYSYEDQVDIAQCCFILHNFIRKTYIYDDDFVNYDTYDDDIDHEEYDGQHVIDAVQFRDQLAQYMWDEYVKTLIARGEYIH
jgi:hypothetical protein